MPPSISRKSVIRPVRMRPAQGRFPKILSALLIRVSPFDSIACGFMSLISLQDLRLARRANLIGAGEKTKKKISGADRIGGIESQFPGRNSRRQSGRPPVRERSEIGRAHV